MPKYLPEYEVLDVSYQEKCEDYNGIIKTRKSKKDIQCNDK